MLRECLLRKGPQRIGEILVQRGWLTQEDVDYALSLQKDAGTRRVGEIFLGLGWLTPGQLSRAIAEQFQLEFLDPDVLTNGWTLLRELYSWKCKNLRILPLRDPEQRVFLVISELTEPQKLHLESDELVDLSRIQFAVTTATFQMQVFNEHQAWDEPEEPTSKEPICYPTPPSWLRTLQDPIEDSSEQLPVEALQALGLDGSRVPHSPKEQASVARTAVQTSLQSVPPSLLALSLERLLSSIGALWGRSATELQRSARILIQRGSRLRIEVSRPVLVPEQIVLQKGPVRKRVLGATTFSPFQIQVTIPWFSVDESSLEASWPKNWPPKDLVDSLDPLLTELCLIIPSLKTSENSIRWLGRDTLARRRLNRHTMVSMGLSLEDSRIDDKQELWSALLARARRLEANRVARGDWTKWKVVHDDTLDICPGGILGLASLILDQEPERVAGSLQVDVTEGPAFSLEIVRSAGGPTTADCGHSGITLRVVLPAAATTPPNR